MIDFGDQPVIGRPHLPDFQFAGRNRIKRAVLVIATRDTYPIQLIGKHRMLPFFLGKTCGARRQAHSCGIDQGIVGLRRDQRRMRPQKHEMREPRAVAPDRKPFQERVGQECSFAVLGRIDRRNVAEATIVRFFETGLGTEDISPAAGQVVTLGEKVRDPFFHFVRQMQRRLESRHHAFIGLE